MTGSNWTADDVPDQAGRVAVITGANSGIGFEAAKVLAGANAHVVMACRNQTKATAAMDDVLLAHPNASVEVVSLDVSSLDSVRQAAAAINETHPTIDLLINNAGIMATPQATTVDGFEAQFATNHLGHFALTGLLAPSLLGGQSSRVVSVSSVAHKVGRINFDDINHERRYLRWQVYAQSKLANLLFTAELHRRLSNLDTATLAVAAHPGSSSTNLGRLDTGQRFAWLQNKVFMPVAELMSQNQEMGALPTLRAATDPTVSGNDYYGPDGFAERAGYPVKVGRTKHALNADDARRLWALSEAMTGVDYAEVLPG